MLTFICHPRCTTCKKALDWLEKQGVEFASRDITAQNPAKEELDAWFKLRSGDIRKLFNTSGIQYRALGLKDKLSEMSTEEAIDLLATDGMLVKRPVLVGDDFVLFGFKEAEWTEKLK